MSERTPHLPIQGGSTASRAALRLKAVAAQHASIKIGGFDFPAVRLVRAASEAAA
ncbi:hypothetical protein [Mycobacterium sp. GA-1841]|uniref:hypothetical protein n=1 Tax=Mycobacterium sp. GA-1841 TaxID=1834154 RepID=UPI00158BE01C|nr:hypothetical protein [Mycobacterium sp. GA-1841]